VILNLIISRPKSVLIQGCISPGLADSRADSRSPRRLCSHAAFGVEGRVRGVLPPSYLVLTSQVKMRYFLYFSHQNSELPVICQNPEVKSWKQAKLRCKVFPVSCMQPSRGGGRRCPARATVVPPAPLPCTPGCRQPARPAVTWQRAARTHHRHRDRRSAIVCSSSRAERMSPARGLWVTPVTCLKLWKMFACSTVCSGKKVAEVPPSKHANQSRMFFCPKLQIQKYLLTPCTLHRCKQLSRRVSF